MGLCSAGMYLDNRTAGRGRKPQTRGITSSVTECLDEPSIEKTPMISQQVNHGFLDSQTNYRSWIAYLQSAHRLPTKLDPLALRTSMLLSMKSVVTHHLLSMSCGRENQPSGNHFPLLDQHAIGQWRESIKHNNDIHNKTTLTHVYVLWIMKTYRVITNIKIVGKFPPLHSSIEAIIDRELSL